MTTQRMPTYEHLRHLEAVWTAALMAGTDTRAAHIAFLEAQAQFTGTSATAMITLLYGTAVHS